MTKPTLTITSGEPRTGKTTWAKEQVEADKDRTKRATDFNTAIYLLRAGQNVIFDSEPLTGFPIKVVTFPQAEPVDEEQSDPSEELQAALDEAAALREQLAETLAKLVKEEGSVNEPVPSPAEHANSRNISKAAAK